MFLVIWEYEVAKENQEKFKRIYGVNGKWIKLFQQDDGFLGTDLLKKSGKQSGFITIDKWLNEIAYLKFLEEYKIKYNRLDKECESLILKEKFIGTYSALK
jgi:hypothetical protein